MEEICKNCHCVNECLELKYACDSQEEYGVYLAKVDYCEEQKTHDKHTIKARVRLITKPNTTTYQKWTGQPIHLAGS